MKPEGFVVAVVSFLLTRVVLADVVFGTSGRSALVAATRLFPLVLGLGVVAFGVGLAVSTRSRRYVRTVVFWYLLGSAWMLLLTGLAVIGTADPLAELRRSGVVATAVVGGGVGGLLMGVRSAANRRHRRTLDRRAEQTVLLNRLLRHEVLNALTAIRGYAGLLADGEGDARSFEAVASNVERIEQTVDDVGFIVRTADGTRDALGPVDLSAVVRRCRDRLPDAGERVAVEEFPSVAVRADEHLETVVAHLLTVALERTAGEVAVALDVSETSVGLTVSASGTWLTESERAVLLNGVPEYDDPGVQFEVPIARLLVAEYGGTATVTEGVSETAVTVELLRVGDGDVPANAPGVDATALRNAAVVGVVAGTVMGAILQLFSGQIGIIGGLYGVQTLAVGWVAHLFHSVVFAVLFAALSNRYRDGSAARLVESTALGVGYGFVLWLVAAGVVMSLWLEVVGIGAPLPNFGLVSLAAHLVWGGTLGIVSALLGR